MTQLAPKDLAPGAYWYIVPGKPATVCEKREGEDYVRFTNGSYQRWVKPGERFDGPIQAPDSWTGVGQADSPSGVQMVLATLYADPADIEVLKTYGRGDVVNGLHRAAQLVRGCMLSGANHDSDITVLPTFPDANRAALLAVLDAFDNGENRSADRNPAAAAALKQVYQALNMTWPEIDYEGEHASS